MSTPGSISITHTWRAGMDLLDPDRHFQNIFDVSPAILDATLHVREHQCALLLDRRRQLACSWIGASNEPRRYHVPDAAGIGDRARMRELVDVDAAALHAA